MRKPDSDLKMLPSTIGDAQIVADLEAARDPSDPRDPVMFRFRWELQMAHEARMDKIAKAEGSALAFVAAGHEPWESQPKRYGWIRPVLHPDGWSETHFKGLIAIGESWLREQQAGVAVVRVRESFMDELRVVTDLGYREERRHKLWELNLVDGRERLLAGAETSRAKMREQGIRLMTFDQDVDPERLDKLYELTIAGERDIPTTVPSRTKPFEEWRRSWFDNPGVREDRF